MGTFWGYFLDFFGVPMVEMTDAAPAATADAESSTSEEETPAAPVQVRAAEVAPREAAAAQ